MQDAELDRIYRDMLRAILPSCRVGVLFHRKNRRLIAPWMQQIGSDPEIAPFLSRIDLVPAEVNSIWIRDFGPLFGVDRYHRLVVYDNGYLDPRVELSNFLSTESLPVGSEQAAERSRLSAELESLRGSDISPSIFAAFLQVERRIPTLLVRPPLVLAGGDIMPLDAKTVLLSQSSLEANSGRADFVAAQLKNYFGVEQVHYLLPLPGETIEHLDFVIQVVGPDVILAASPPDFDPSNISSRTLLKKQLRERLDANLSYLREHFPEHRIIEVPLPPPVFESDQAIVSRLLLAAAVACGEELGFTADRSARQASTGEVEISRPVLQSLLTHAGIDRIDTIESQIRVATAYFQQPFEELSERFSSPYTYYRSYLNSLLVVGEQGTETLLLPRFAPNSPAEGVVLSSLEVKVEQAYRTARPRANLVWIDVTSLITNFGALHCLATTMPDHRLLGVK